MKKLLALSLLPTLVLVSILRFWGFFVGKTVFFGDTYSLLVPGKIFSAFWLKQGVLPLWNPYVFGGISWIGDINQSLFSISTIFFLLFSPNVALKSTIVFSTLFSCVGMYIFLRQRCTAIPSAVFGTLFWGIGAFHANGINNFTILATLSFFPWILICSMRILSKNWSKIYLILLLAMAVCAGYPQLLLYVGILILAFSTESLRDWRWYRSWLVVGLGALCLSAVALFPFYDTINNSTRSLQTQEQVFADGLSPASFVSLVFPNVFSYPKDGIAWGPAWSKQAITVPFLPAFFFLCLFFLFKIKLWQRTDTIYFGVCVLALVLASSNFLTVIPFLRFSRGPALALVLIEFIGAVWFARVTDKLWEKKIYPNSMWFDAILALILGLVFLIIRMNFSSLWENLDMVLHGRLSAGGFHTLQRDTLIVAHIFKSTLIHVALFSCMVFFWNAKRVWAFALTLAVLLYFGTSGSIFFAPDSIYPTWDEIHKLWQPGLHRSLINNGNQPYTDFVSYFDALTRRKPFSDSYIDETEMRMYTHLIRMRSESTPDWNMVYGIANIGGYSAFVPKDVNTRWNTKVVPALNTIEGIDYRSPLLTAWGVDSLQIDTWFPNVPFLVPRVSLSPTSRFEFLDTDGKFLHIQENPNTQSIILTATQDGYLLIKDRIEDGWNARRNGVFLTIENDTGRRKIPVQRGKNQIVLWYLPKTFLVGAVVSSTTGVMLLLYHVWRRTKI